MYIEVFIILDAITVHREGERSILGNINDGRVEGLEDEDGRMDGIWRNPGHPWIMDWYVHAYDTMITKTRQDKTSQGGCNMDAFTWWRAQGDQYMLYMLYIKHQTW